MKAIVVYFVLSGIVCIGLLWYLGNTKGNKDLSTQQVEVDLVTTEPEEPDVKPEEPEEDFNTLPTDQIEALVAELSHYESWHVPSLPSNSVRHNSKDFGIFAWESNPNLCEIYFTSRHTHMLGFYKVTSLELADAVRDCFANMTSARSQELSEFIDSLELDDQVEAKSGE